jgi:hypothetical protein
MDRNAIFWAGRLLLGAIGVVLMFGSVPRLGRARAAANWPTATPVSRYAAPLGRSGIGAGLLALAAAVGLSLGALTEPSGTGPVPHAWRGWLVAGTGAAVVFALGLLAARRLVNQAEVTALIRTPPRFVAARVPTGAATDATPPPTPDTPAQDPRTPATVDPAVPAGGEPGWVYRDSAGAWYVAVAVAARGGQRLVRLDDFTLVPVGAAEGPLRLAGSVEISVWPVADRVPGAP